MTPEQDTNTAALAAARRAYGCPGCDTHDYAGCQVERCARCESHEHGYRQGSWEMLNVLFLMISAPDHDPCACEPCQIYVLTRNGKKAEAFDKAKALRAEQEAAYASVMNCAAHGGDGHCNYGKCDCWPVECGDPECPEHGTEAVQAQTAAGCTGGEYFKNTAELAAARGAIP